MATNKFNRSLKELATSSLEVDSDLMDEFYKIKGLEF